MKVKIQLTNTYYKSIDLEYDIDPQSYEDYKLKYPDFCPETDMEDYLIDNEGEYSYDIEDMMSAASLKWGNREWKYEINMAKLNEITIRTEIKTSEEGRSIDKVLMLERFKKALKALEIWYDFEGQPINLDD